MGSLYVKGAKLWARYKDEDGVWKGAPTPYRPGDEANARRFLKTLGSRKPAPNRPLRNPFSTESRDCLLPVLLPPSEIGGIVGETVRPQRDSKIESRTLPKNQAGRDLGR